MEQLHTGGGTSRRAQGRRLLAALATSTGLLLGLGAPAALASQLAVEIVKPGKSPSGEPLPGEGAEGKATVPAHEKVPFKIEFTDVLENPEPCPPCTSEATVEWHFGDGSEPALEHVTVNANPNETYYAETTHEFSTPGKSYTAEVLVKVPYGGESTERITIETGAALLTSLAASQYFPYVGEPVTFTAKQELNDYKPPLSYHFLLNGNPVQEVTIDEGAPAPGTYEQTFTSTGAQTVAVKASAEASTEAKRLETEAATTVDVVPHLGGAVTVSPPNPYVGETVTFSALAEGGEPPYTYSGWLLDGGPFPGAGTATAPEGTRASEQAKFTTTGTHTVTLGVSDSSRPKRSESLTASVSVDQPLVASITPAGEAYDENRPLSFEAHVAGGTPPYEERWRLFPIGYPEYTTAAGAGATFSHTFNSHFESSGAYGLVLSANDSDGHITTIEKRILAQPCIPTVEFGLIQLASKTGCLQQSTGAEGVKRWSTETEVLLNGIPLQPIAGHPLVLEAPSSAHPGGLLEVGNVNLTIVGTELDFALLHEKPLKWELPKGEKGEEKSLVTLSVPAGLKLLGLSVGGSIGVKLGYGTDGEHFATFPLTIELPKIFKSGPNKEAGGLTSEAALSVGVSASGLAAVHFKGLRVELNEAWLGKLQIKDLCLAFIPGGSEAISECAKPSVGGKEFIECQNTSTTADRWSGTAVVVLPTTSKTEIGLFGGLVGSQIAYLGGFVETNPGLPIVDDVFLDRVGIGVCINPPPFKLKGEVGVDAMPVGSKPTLKVDGYFQYTNSYTDSEGHEHPWSVELGGSVAVYEKEIGGGDVVVNSTGELEFALHAELELYSVVSINGHVDGWIEPTEKLFNINGGIEACLLGACIGADGEVSSTGIAGCGKILGLEAGFGYRWGSGHVSTFDGCSFGEYEATKASLADFAPNLTRTLAIAPHTKAIALRVGGLGGPPGITLRGPGGQTIVIPAGASKALRGPDYMVIENRSEAATDILLADPAAGSWQIQPALGSSVTSLAIARYYGPPSASGHVRKAPHGRRLLRATYHLQPGETMALYERGSEVARTLRAHVAGAACSSSKRGRRGHRAPAGARCLRVAFSPTFGPGGERSIVAVVSRGGIPQRTITIARFHVPAPRALSRPRLQLLRTRKGVLLAWSHLAGAARYTISVRTSSRKKLGFNPPARCGALLLRGIARKEMVTASVGGVRRNLEAGPARKLLLRSKRKRAGVRRLRHGRICRAG
ncbi:MAG TPA: hypothetical protein VKU89_01945 [Solirubrobacteraceae bacterium]|nr:hypothetical protein [Solirubrobacteraceae bacterium]